MPKQRRRPGERGKEQDGDKKIFVCTVCINAMEVKSCLSRSRSLSHIHFVIIFSFYLFFSLSLWYAYLKMRFLNSTTQKWFVWFLILIFCFVYWWLKNGNECSLSKKQQWHSVRWTMDSTRDTGKVTCNHMRIRAVIHGTHVDNVFVKTSAFSLSHSLSHSGTKQIKRFNQIELWYWTFGCISILMMNIVLHLFCSISQSTPPHPPTRCVKSILFANSWLFPRFLSNSCSIVGVFESSIIHYYCIPFDIFLEAFCEFECECVCFACHILYSAEAFAWETNWNDIFECVFICLYVCVYVCIYCCWLSFNFKHLFVSI